MENSAYFPEFRTPLGQNGLVCSVLFIDSMDLDCVSCTVQISRCAMCAMKFNTAAEWWCTRYSRPYSVSKTTQPTTILLLPVWQLYHASYETLRGLCVSRHARHCLPSCANLAVVERWGVHKDSIEDSQWCSLVAHALWKGSSL